MLHPSDAAGSSPPPPRDDFWRNVAVVLFADALLLALAIWQNWSPGALLWPYWMQSMALGIGQSIRIARLGRRHDGTIVDGVMFTAQLLPHLIFLLMLFMLFPPHRMPEGGWIWSGGLFLLASQALETWRRMRRDAATEPDIDKVAASFKHRFLAMHAMTLIGFGFAGMFASSATPHGHAPQLLTIGVIKILFDCFGIHLEQSIDGDAFLRARRSQRRRLLRERMPIRHWPFSVREKQRQDAELAATMPPPPDDPGRRDA